jgi:hypothetical protein
MASFIKIGRERPHDITHFSFYTDFISRSGENILRLTGTQNV